MSPEEIRKLVTTTPFRPFTLNIADGRRVPVVDRDYILVSPSGRTIHVYQKDETSEMLDSILITGASLDALAIRDEVTLNG